ncbi:hypothetical protein FBU59_000679 [Linderina macrospora]|uniref:Uncharacterized protein n=1 Tax=Linderina macrospora TaxID=4868 RepID=A0ACC1JGD4_9FUNG|nr:hypothetical protein FBU59_000679 [Linderina macrospora]
MRWLRNKGAVIQAEPILDYHSVSDFMDIPKNPVFYPPTLQKTLQPVSPASPKAPNPIHAPTRADVKNRPSRILSRFKTMFASKPAGDFHPGNTSFEKDSPTNPAKPRAAHQSKLVARSPLREDSGWPDLRELVGSGVAMRPSQDEHHGSPHTLYSSTRFYTRMRRSTRKWPQFDSPADMSQNSSLVLFESALGLCPRQRRPSRIDVTRVASENPGWSMRHANGTARSVSMIVPSAMSQELSRLAALVAQDSMPGCRVSRGSDVTAISSQGMFSEHDSVGSMSPSQLSACTLEDESLSVEESSADHSSEELACNELVGMPLVETHEGLGTLLRVTRSIRRPHSDDFLQHARITMGTSLGLSVEEDLYEVMCGSSFQREMYIRNSCVDSGLLKSTFDLVKLLPATPQ